jgi:thiol-disulfide isomerase/thioredoxin
MLRKSLWLVSGILITMLLFGRAMPEILAATPAPDIKGAPWFNSEPLSLEQLKGKVVLVEFWTYGCYNCRNVEPYIKQWYERYQSRGLTVVAVHTPEFDSERQPENVQRYITGKNIRYPVVMDNDFSIWKRYGNRYWPTMYLVDRQGRLVYKQIGEGNYDATERQIKALLDTAN